MAGDDRRIHHGINLARDAVQQAGKNKSGCGLLDLDFLAGFDWLDMAWVYLVLAKKGLSETVINRIKNLYADSISVVMVNNVQGRAINNLRGSLRQGDVPSMFWFAVGIDPLLLYLEKRLKGIPITSLPVLGPSPEHERSSTVENLRQDFKLIAYADGVKPAISSMQEFYLVDRACSLLEQASGVKLHRNLDSGKVKFLPLGRWRGTLTQEDLPHQYVRLSDFLDFVGVELRATFSLTRKANGDILQTRIKNTVGPWKSGRFMPLSQRAFSANCYALSKVWFKCCVVNLRVQDITVITSQIKSWMYQDLLLKPSELVLYRGTDVGGLGLMCVKMRSLALLVRTFLETSINPKFRHSLFHEQLFRYHVLGESNLPDPGFTPYYDRDFFDLIIHYKNNSPLNIATMTTKQWYSVLLEDKVIMNPATEVSAATLIPVRIETIHPNTDWPAVWKLVRMKGLGSELISFQLKMLHSLLPTRDRVARLGLDEGQAGLCLHCRMDVEDLTHCFFDCSRNMVVGLALLGCVQQIIPDLSADAAVRLDFRLRLTDEENMAALYILITGLKYIWEMRSAKKVVLKYKMRAEIEAMVSILRKTRHQNTATRIEELIRMLM